MFVFILNFLSLFMVVLVNVIVFLLVRKKREVLFNKSEEEDNDLKCNLVKLYNYFLYINKFFL